MTESTKRWLMLICLVALVAVIAPSVSAGTPPSTFEAFPLNIHVFRVVNDNHNPSADAFFAHLAPLYWVLPAIVAILAAIKINKKVFWAALIAVAIDSLIVHVMKAAFHQPRPLVVLDGVHSFKGLMLYTKSFPSADAALCFAIAASMRGLVKKPVQIVLYLYGVLIVYERMYVGAHFPLDVTVGSVIGLISGWAGSWIVLKRGKPAE